MAYETSTHGQLSPPDSNPEEHGVSHYEHRARPGNSSLAPYSTPPLNPIHSYNYADPEEYELQQQQGFYDQDGPYYPEGAYRTPPQPITRGGIQTRSGRSIGTSATASSPGSRMSQSPRPKRKRKGKANDLQYKITEPLSIMTAEYEVPVEDMMAWVNRSNEDRYGEVSAKHNGKVPRPMNSFMLYRRAYKERIKRWGAQGDNNQLISSVAGLSWNMEPADVKEHYAKIANLERDNHAKAFPNYKFAPVKTVKKRDRDDDDDSDPEWDSGSSYSSKRRRGRHDRDVTRTRSTTPAHMMYSSPRFHPSSLQAANPHLIPGHQYYPVHPAYNHPYEYEQMGYTQQPAAVPYGYGPTSTPLHHEPYMTPLVGLPPGEGLMEGEHMPQSDFAIDPGLGDYASSIAYHNYGSYPGEIRTHEAYGEETEALLHPGMQTLAPAEPAWSPTNKIGGAFDAELNRWHD